MGSVMGMHMVSAVIVAAGRGVRMGADARKQYLEVAGKSIVGRTLAVFHGSVVVNRIFLVAPEADFPYCRDHILGPLGLEKAVRLVPGGRRRQDSVYHGLLAAEKYGGIVVIHDGVRPFVPPGQIEACVAQAEETGGCIVALPAGDTLKQVDAAGHIEHTIDRKTVWLAQTPQAFQYRLIREAHEAARRDGVAATDDAFLLERMGRRVKVLPGSRYNIKITTPEDLPLAEVLARVCP